jgi:hypothetical protein
LDKTNAELKSYLAATSMGVVARGAGTAPLRDTQITVKIGLDIQVRSY